jgi:hypothetical protein
VSDEIRLIDGEERYSGYSIFIDGRLFICYLLIPEKGVLPTNSS